MNYALITGASKGIGKAFAYECASRKMNLVLVARNENLLRELSNDLVTKYAVDVKFLALDLILEDSCNKIFEYVNDQKISVNLLINNAGSAYFGNFGRTDLKKNLESVKLNVEACIKLTHLFIAHYDRTQKCYILNVSSTAAFQALPNLSIYAATKTFLLSFTKTLQYEQKSSNLFVSIVCPGGADSEFFVDARMDHIAERNKNWLMEPSQIAKISLNGLFKNKKIIIPGFYNKLHLILLKIIPDPIVLFFTARIYKEK